MQQKVEAVFEHGVFRPLEPVSLKDAQQVVLTISDLESGRSRRDLEVVERAHREVAAYGEVPSIEEVRSALSLIPGRLSEVVVSERGNY
jgi:predicted DNA-binding antitoxin AbrB/MazE fold protein